MATKLTGKQHLRHVVLDYVRDHPDMCREGIVQQVWLRNKDLKVRDIEDVLENFNPAHEELT